MKKLILILISFHCGISAQNLDNDDSCRMLICNRPWVIYDWKLENNSLVKTDSISNKITFFKNGTFIKTRSFLNHEGQLNKQEKGTWKFSGKADRFLGDSVNCVRDIALSVKTRVGLDVYYLRLINGRIYKNKPNKRCSLCPKEPYLFLKGGAEEDFFIQGKFN